MFEVMNFVIIDEMEGEPQYKGKCGFIEKIDDMGQLHGTWGGVAINPEVDKIRVYKGSKLIYKG